MSKSLEWGWMLVRIGLGVHWLLMGITTCSGKQITLQAVAYVVAGILTALGLLVRPSSLFLFCVMAWVTFSLRGGGVGLHVSLRNFPEFLSVLGVIVGGGGRILALGMCMAGLRGRWWQ